VHEWNLADRLRRARFASSNAFARETLEERAVNDGALHVEAKFKVRAAALDHHGLPSLAFAFEEAQHINVWKNRLTQLGLPTGAWLTQLRSAVQNGAADDTPIQVCWRTRDGTHEQVFDLGYLKREVLELVPGQRVCYVTDAAGHEENYTRLVKFLAGAELAFMEAVFLHADVEQADRKAHMTARRSGLIARAAGVRNAVPFHFSTRYLGRGVELQQEFAAAWQPTDATPTLERLDVDASNHDRTAEP
jgi:ribonuclease Z